MSNPSPAPSPASSGVSSKVAPYAKAIIGALIAGVSVIAAGVTDGHLSAGEWVSALLAALVALGGVYKIPNADPTATHQDESVTPPPTQAG